MDNSLSMNKALLKKEFVKLLYKEGLITKSEYYKAIELLEKETKNGNSK